MNLLQLRLRLEKIYRWEFWPMHVFLWPIYLQYLVLSLLARDWFWFKYANICMPFSGLQVGKKKILDFFDLTLLPKTVLISAQNLRDNWLNSLQSEFSLPVIAKPDKGCRGSSVKKIDTWDDLKNYVQNFSGDLLVQEFIDLPLEFGIFYVRRPGQEAGKITSFMQRDFSCLVGDGTTDLRGLIRRHPRAKFYEDLFLLSHDPTLVLKKDQKLQMGFIGNHCKGTTFLDCNDKITPKLTTSIDKISKQVPDFYYGRYDVKAASWEALERGDFKIMELNGFFSEPAHVYDPDMPLWKAWRDYLWHHREMFRIARLQRHKKLPKMSFKVQKGILFQ